MTRNARIQQEIARQIEESIAVKRRVLEEMGEPIAACAAKMVETLRKGGKLLLCGNGGSAADAQHIAAELVVRLRGAFERPAIPALALTVDTSVLTACSNDYGFERVFARQIEALGQPGDVLIAISTSGNSPNVIEAVHVARQKGIYVVGWLGGAGGRLQPLVDLPLVVPSSTTARIQEAHILIGHIVCQIVETELFAESSNRP
ncbi:MAG: SIS domain-containing protein [Calditrichaeota bacterium]|nr:MAG: SIS domain-containing protein [Calditrichota bacterium]